MGYRAKEKCRGEELAESGLGTTMAGARITFFALAGNLFTRYKCR